MANPGQRHGCSHMQVSAHWRNCQTHKFDLVRILHRNHRSHLPRMHRIRSAMYNGKGHRHRTLRLGRQRIVRTHRRNCRAHTLFLHIVRRTGICQKRRFRLRHNPRSSPRIRHHHRIFLCSWGGNCNCRILPNVLRRRRTPECLSSLPYMNTPVSRQARRQLCRQEFHRCSQSLAPGIWCNYEVPMHMCKLMAWCVVHSALITLHKRD